MGLRPLTIFGVGREIGLTSGPTKAVKAAVLGRRFLIEAQMPTSALRPCGHGRGEGREMFRILLIDLGSVLARCSFFAGIVLLICFGYGRMASNLRNYLGTFAVWLSHAWAPSSKRKAVCRQRPLHVCCVHTCGNIPAKRAQIPAKRAQIQNMEQIVF